MTEFLLGLYFGGMAVLLLLSLPGKFNIQYFVNLRYTHYPSKYDLMKDYKHIMRAIILNAVLLVFYPVFVPCIPIIGYLLHLKQKREIKETMITGVAE